MLASFLCQILFCLFPLISGAGLPVVPDALAFWFQTILLAVVFSNKVVSAGKAATDSGGIVLARHIVICHFEIVGDFNI